MTWKFTTGERGISIDSYDLSGPMRISRRCEVCDVAWEMGLSEAEFQGRFEPMERAQLLATYRSQAKRNVVVIKYPMKE